MSAVECPVDVQASTSLSHGPDHLIAVTIQAYNLGIRVYNDYTFLNKDIVLAKHLALHALWGH